MTKAERIYNQMVIEIINRSEGYINERLTIKNLKDMKKLAERDIKDTERAIKYCGETEFRTMRMNAYKKMQKKLDAMIEQEKQLRKELDRI